MKELAKGELAFNYPLHAQSVPVELPADQRALAAIIVNMLVRHTHAQRVAILKFALEREQFIPVSKASVFAGTSIMPGKAPQIE